MPAYLVVTIKSWNIENFNRLKQSDTTNEWHVIERKEDLTYERVKKIQPRFIFFPHWSWIIPKEIYEQFECVVFHMTDLPYGRGGSPLQNLIVRGHTETKVSAIHVVKELDAGAIYLKRPLTLNGSANDIFRRLSSITFEMIKEIVSVAPAPVQQTGEIVEFKRRTPIDGDIGMLESIREVYDYIRMLDGEGYPRAFLETEHMRLEFDGAVLDENNRLTARVFLSLKHV